MEEHSLEAQEKGLRGLLAVLDTGSFLISFSMYLAHNPDTQHTLFFKAAALLSHLATRDSVEFNRLVQTLKKEDLDNAFVAFVVEVWERLSQYDSDALKSAHEGCCEDLRGLMRIVLDNHLSSAEAILKQDIGTDGCNATMPRDHVQSVRDCIFVVNNFSGN